MNLEPFAAGVVIAASSRDEQLRDLDPDTVVQSFERHGVVLFRGFSASASEVRQFTDRFTESYASDALRRSTRLDETVMHEVASGNGDIVLHSEACFAPSWPEIIWFYCVTAPSDGGETTLCDGSKIWPALSKNAKQLFLAQPILYDVAIQVPVGKRRTGTSAWPSAVPGITGYLDWAAGTVNLKVLRYAVQPGRSEGLLCFANYVLEKTEPQLRRVSMADGTPIRDDVLAEALSVSDACTVDLKWASGDLVMVDNMRFMHGRRSFSSAVQRDVVQIQTQRASFPYGATTRRSRLSAQNL